MPEKFSGDIKFPISIKERFEYKFNIKKDGLYSILLKASCKNGKFFGLFGGEDLRVEIDDIKLRELPAKDKPQYYNIPPAWNGTKLKGLSKIVIFILQLKAGKHEIKFIPKRGAVIDKEPSIVEIKNSNDIKFVLNEKAQDGNRRPWIMLPLIDLPLKILDASAQCEKRKWDSDDVKLIIDGKVQKNESGNWWGRNWYWQGKKLKGDTEDRRFDLDLEKSNHYIEFWADRMPILNDVWMYLGLKKESEEDGKQEETQEEIKSKNKVQMYDQFHGTGGKEDYNRFDNEIIEAVDYWNNFFVKQEYPPEKLLDYNLVKAIIYRESRVGYQRGGEVDVMQVGNEGDPALDTLRGKLEEREWINGEEVKLDYQAKIEIPKDSVYWGVRWLYHKAQGITFDEKRYWRSWKNAVLGYGPGTAEYVDYVWRVYKEGRDFNGKVEKRGRRFRSS
ncbi:hypothetical protein ACFL23_05025, partial [Patescibacteria group bacterium]